MPEMPTPGQVAHAAFAAALPERRYFPAPGWDTVPPHAKRAWETAADAVLDAWQAQPRLEEQRDAR